MGVNAFRFQFVILPCWQGLESAPFDSTHPRSRKASFIPCRNHEISKTSMSPDRFIDHRQFDAGRPGIGTDLLEPV